MPTTLTMPKLSPTMEAGTIVKWLKREGDEIKTGEVVFEVATDKATVEYIALDKGFLKKILIQEGQDANVNDPVAIMTATQSESIEGYQVESVKNTDPVVKEIKKEVEKEAAKTTSSPKASGAMAQPSFTPFAPLDDYAFEWPVDPLDGRVMASPLAKKLAKDKGVDLASVKGSGPNDRVVAKDIDRALPDSIASFSNRERPNLSPGSYEEEALSPMRKVIAERLQASKTFIPHIYVQQQVVVDELVKVREHLKTFDIKITFNDLILRACALALKEHPAINSGFNSDANKIIRFKTIDIAVAVSIDGGLITPIVRHADYKNVAEISSEVKALAKKAKENKLKPHEFQGGSFTISNLGMYGVDAFSAIINPPQAAILAVGGILEQAIIRDGKVAPAQVLMLTLSADHRVIDGADAALFLVTLKKLLENPSILIIG